MSTNATVILKLRKEDKGKEVKFDPNKLPKGIKDELWSQAEKDVDKTQPITIKGKYLSIYCHWDGYPDFLQKVLEEHYTTYEEVLNLMAGGDCSAITSDCVIRYAKRDREHWSDIEAAQDNTIKGIYKQIYSYIFKEGEGWKLL